jgi:hypothetical protein
VHADFSLMHAGVVHGDVLTDTGRSVAGAEVSVIVPGVEDEVLPVEERSLAVTDATGRYEVTDVPAGRFTVLCRWETTPDQRVPVARCAYAWDVPVDAEHSARADFRLAAGATLAGRFTDGSEEAFGAGHVLEVWSVRGEPWTEPPIERDARVDVSEDGAFEVTGLDAGVKLVKLLSPRHGDRHVRSFHRWVRRSSRTPGEEEDPDATRATELLWRTRVPAEGLRDQQLVVGGHGSLGGRVLDPAGAAVEWVELAAMTLENKDMSQCMTGEDGEFRFLSVHPWDFPLVVVIAHAERLRAAIPLDMLPQGADLGVIPLAQQAALDIEVVDAESGEAVPDAVAVWHLGGGGQSDTVIPLPVAGPAPWQVVADRSSGSWVLTVTAEGHRAWRRSDVLKPGEDPENVVVRLERD